MSRKPRILITAAAGKTGKATALQLRQKGYPVRALVRRRDHRSAELEAAGAELFIGDMFNIQHMRRALTDIQRAYLCPPATANGLHGGAVFAVAAAEARLEHVVAMSQWLSDSRHPSLATREIWLIGELLKRTQGTGLTVNNVGWFADNYMLVMAPIAQLGLLPMPLGDGLNAPPSNEDIAAVNVGALVDPAEHAGKTYRPTGPKLLNPEEIAATFAKVLGRSVRYQDISERLFMKALKADGRPEYMMTQLRYYAEDYRRNAFGIGAPTDAVERVGGRAPDDFETIVRRYAAAMPEAKRSFVNKWQAVGGLAKILMAPQFDALAVERSRDHVLIEDALYAPDNADWLGTHDGRAPADTAFPRLAEAP